MERDRQDAQAASTWAIVATILAIVGWIIAIIAIILALQHNPPIKDGEPATDAVYSSSYIESSFRRRDDPVTLRQSDIRQISRYMLEHSNDHSAPNIASKTAQVRRLNGRYRAKLSTASSNVQRS